MKINMKIKKIIYITLFTFFGSLLQLIVHGLVENWYINLLLSDFTKYSLGFSWTDWFVIHHVVTVILFVGGALFGVWQGKYWWRKIYQENIRKLDLKEK